MLLDGERNNQRNAEYNKINFLNILQTSLLVFERLDLKILDQVFHFLT